LSSLLSTG